MKAYQFKITKDKVSIETFVYSEHGKDIDNRFPGWKVSDIKEIDDPVSQQPTKKKD